MIPMDPWVPDGAALDLAPWRHIDHQIMHLAETQIHPLLAARLVAIERMWVHVHAQGLTDFGSFGPVTPRPAPVFRTLNLAPTLDIEPDDGPLDFGKDPYLSFRAHEKFEEDGTFGIVEDIADQVRNQLRRQLIHVLRRDSFYTDHWFA